MLDDREPGDAGATGTAPVMVVEAKVAGARRPVLSGLAVPIPGWPAGGEHREGGVLQLRDLIAATVRHEVQAFRERQEERRLARVLAPRDIAEGSARGKVDPGGPRDAVEVDPEQAVAVAWQAFEDGLYFVFLDGAQQQSLDAPVYPHPGSALTFIRLVALAGG